MRKPDNITYGTEEIPPAGVLVALAVQHVIVISIFLVAVVVIARAARIPFEQARNLIALTLIALCVATLLQIRRTGPIGSGLLVIPAPQSAYVPGSLIAARLGGLPMVAGFLLVSAGLELILSRFQRRLRGLLPAELSGLIVLVTGLGVAQSGMDNIVNSMAAESGATWPASLGVAVSTLAVMVALSVWARGPLRTLGAIIGVLAGYAAGYASGLVDPTLLHQFAAAPLFALPQLAPVRPEFDAVLLLPALVSGLAITLNSIGALTAAQRIGDADWKRQDIAGLSRGLLSDSLGTMAAALLGGAGVSASGSSVGLTATARATSRAIGYVAAPVFLLLSLTPKFAVLVLSMPQAVLGAALVFLSCSLLISGVSIMSSRLLDARKTFCLGIAFAFAVTTPALTRISGLLPDWMLPVVASPLLASALVAIVLNPIMRLGIRQQAELAVPPGGLDTRDLTRFIERSGAAWGARREVIAQAQGPIAECLDTLTDAAMAPEGASLVLGFNELQLDARISWCGSPLPLSKTRPTKQELMEEDDAPARMAGYLIGRLTSRVSSRSVGDRSELHLVFDH